MARAGGGCAGGPARRAGQGRADRLRRAPHGAHAVIREADVLVVGAGPAGAAAALELTRSGLRPLIADSRLPDPQHGGPRLVEPRRGGPGGHDVLLNQATLRTLSAMGLAGRLRLRPVESIELRLGPHDTTAQLPPTHRFPGATASVCDRDDLDGALLAAVTRSAATCLKGTVGAIIRDEAGRQLATVHRDDGPPVTVSARHVIVASGSPPSGNGLVCTRRIAGTGLGARFVLHLPAPRTADPAEIPVCLWVAPGAEEGILTIGAARVGPADPTDLLDLAVTTLRAAHPELTMASPCGPPVTGPLNSSFTPGNAVAEGRLLTGDAAGLVNPFTGEGVSYALQSGLIAAQAVAEHQDDPHAAGRAYKRRLSSAFVGYFETARHAARRYHLGWRVLVSTAGSTRPVFAKARRAVLLPEGLSGLTAAELMPMDAADVATLTPFLLACDEVAVSTVRKQWPFIARLLIAGEQGPHRRLRPAAPFLGALLSAGKLPDITRATLAAAIELATLGALSFLGPMPPEPERGRTVDWSLTAGVLAGDFLLAQATRLVAASAPDVAWSFADWLGELAVLRARRAHPGHDAAAGAVFASLLEFPARIGGRLGGAPPSVIEALREYGEQCGHAFMHAEDALALRGERTRMDLDLRSMLDGRLSAIPDLLGEDAASAALDGDPLLLEEALTATLKAGFAARNAAETALDRVPHPRSARILRAFLRAVTQPMGFPPQSRSA
ncbi:hypothetical protein GBF35_29180 [Nonomuraea phyllanthi]|nr:hypothetical protein GBF35_29180 [Nonomuraea phyllanthi]